MTLPLASRPATEGSFFRRKFQHLDAFHFIGPLDNRSLARAVKP
jgi:hypothetical protein